MKTITVTVTSSDGTVLDMQRAVIDEGSVSTWALRVQSLDVAGNKTDAVDFELGIGDPKNIN
jgi:hypothetical protein